MAETETKRAWVSDEDFIDHWQAANSAEEVADALDYKLSSVNQRARTLRKAHDVPLKRFASNRAVKKDDAYWERMRAYAQERLPVEESDT